MLYPSSVVKTNSHTTLINSLGVAGLGVGGIVAEAVMLGQTISKVLPDVASFKLTCSLTQSTTATDLILTFVHMSCKRCVVDKFVEFYSGDVKNLNLADRATIANMAPWYGATTGYFPIDEHTIEYLNLTGREIDSQKLYPLKTTDKTETIKDLDLDPESSNCYLYSYLKTTTLRQQIIDKP